TLPLHRLPNPRMYGVLTAITPGCVAFSLPVQRRNGLFWTIPAFFRPSQSQREPRGRKEGRFLSPGGVRSQALTPQGTVLTGDTAITGPGGVHLLISGWRSGAAKAAISDRQAAHRRQTCSRRADA